MSSNVVGVSLVISALWGIQPIMCKSILKDVSYITLMLFTSIIDVICVVIYAYLHKETVKSDVITKKHFMMLLFITIFTIFLTSVMYYNILKDNTSFIVTALTYTAPVFTLIAGYITLEESIHMSDVIGILMVVAGIIILSSVGH